MRICGHIDLLGPGIAGTRVNGLLLQEVLSVLIGGSRKALRLRTQGRSTARGTRPEWIDKVTDFTVQILEGSTRVQVEAPSLLEAGPDELKQTDLFPEIDPGRTAFDYLLDSLNAALPSQSGDDSLYDRPFLEFLARLNVVFSYGVETVNFIASANGSPRRQIAIQPRDVAGFRDLQMRIPPPQTVRVSGKLDAIRHSDRTFVLELGDGTRVRGVATAPQDDELRRLWSMQALVLGTAHFTSKGALQRIEAEAIRPASENDAFWSSMPRPLGGEAEALMLREAQGQRTGLNAVFGQWPGDETDDQILSALRDLS